MLEVTILDTEVRGVVRRGFGCKFIDTAMKLAIKESCDCASSLC